ncbi:MAG: molybdopterin-dependent oxidoreductase, partial [Deltaproteobacteria bacterium]|nr:molybdopterin-dependent oxidoreductase [Deltaproteobacteria bacterium]
KPNLTRAGSGSGIWRAITEDKPYPIRGIIWDTNALALCPRGKRVREALREMKIIVHLGQFPNVTYHHSHVVFPIASFLETEGLVSESIGRYLQWANQVVAPLGECRPADDFWGGLFQRFAFSSFPFIAENGKVDIREMSRFFLDRCPFTSGITPDLLDPDKNLPGGIQWPAAPGEIDYPSHRAAVRGDERLF